MLVSSYGLSALKMFTSRYGRIDIAKYLIEAKASLYVQEEIDFAISFDDS